MFCPGCGLSVGKGEGQARRLMAFDIINVAYPKTTNTICRRYQCRTCQFRWTSDELIRYDSGKNRYTKFGDWVVGNPGDPGGRE